MKLPRCMTVPTELTLVMKLPKCGTVPQLLVELTVPLQTELGLAKVLRRETVPTELS